jgi:hypothetical protein
MSELWREWVTDNPFFRRDLVRWVRRGRLWKVPLAISGGLSLAVLFTHALSLAIPEIASGSYRGAMGLLLFCIVSFFHAVLVAVTSGASFSLPDEARTDRLDFIRLLPLPPRELLAKMGIARGILRTAAVLSALPIYLVLLAYGGLPWEDVAALYVLLFSFIIASPGSVEVTNALTFRRGGEDATAGQANNRGGWAWWVVIQMFIQFGGRTFLGPLFRWVWSRIARAVGPQVSALWFFSIVACAARLLWLPQQFFHWVLTPLLPLTLYWAVGRVHRLIAAAELWNAEAVPVPSASGRVVVRLSTPDSESRRRQLVWWTLNGGLLAVTVAGFAWHPLIETGVLGALLVKPTAGGNAASTTGGGVAVLLLIAAVLGFLSPFEWWRGQALPEQTTLRFALWQVGLCLGRPLVFGLLICTLGGVSPAEPVRALLLLAPILSVALVFAEGWRRGLTSRAETVTPGGASLKTFLIGMLWLATYLAPPLAMWHGAPSVAWHAAAALSPFYAALALLPGAWPYAAGPALPFWATLLLPAVAGGLLIATAPRRAAAVRERAPRTKPDPVETWLAAKARQWDNPYITLALHRQARRPDGLTLRLAIAAVIALLPVLGLLYYLTSSAAAGAIPTLGSILAAAEQGRETIRAVLLGVSFVFLLWLVWIISLSSGQPVTAEAAAGRQQQRLVYLLISGITDRQIVLGLLGTGLLAAGPAILGSAGFSLTCTLLALALGSQWWWLPAWLLVFASIEVGALRSSLSHFRTWRKWPRRVMIWRIVMACVGTAAGVVAVIFAAPAVVGWVTGNLFLALTLFVLAYLAGSIWAAATLPATYRKALQHVHLCRLEDDLERKS